MRAGELPKGEDGSYGTSLIMSRAMDPTADVILAYRQNGRLLTPDHGYPLRCAPLGASSNQIIHSLTHHLLVVLLMHLPQVHLGRSPMQHGGLLPFLWQNQAIGFTLVCHTQSPPLLMVSPCKSATGSSSPATSAGAW